MKALSYIDSKGNKINYYPIRILSKPITNKKDYLLVDSIEQIKDVYFWASPSGLSLTHEIYYEPINNDVIIKQIKKRMIWVKNPKTKTKTRQINLF
jgi:hypothetical protein